VSEQDNVKVVQQAYDAFGRRDIKGILDRCTDDIDWQTYGPEALPLTKPRRGRQQVQEFFDEVEQSWNFETFEPREFIAQGDHVICLGRYTGTAKGTGRPFAAEWAMHFALRNGKVARFREYTDTANVLSAYETKAARAGA
jgi:ketosteroid isomerase-like protein